MATDRNTIVFTLEVQCLRNPNASKIATDPSELYINHEVRSGHLVWKPAGEQEEVFASQPPAPLNKDIVLAKLRPGMAVNMEVHAMKGVGKDHAKFSPVGVSVSIPFLDVDLRTGVQRRRPIASCPTSRLQNRFHPRWPKNSRNVSHRASFASTHGQKRSALMSIMQGRILSAARCCGTPSLRIRWSWVVYGITFCVRLSLSLSF